MVPLIALPAPTTPPCPPGTACFDYKSSVRVGGWGWASPKRPTTTNHATATSQPVKPCERASERATKLHNQTHKSKLQHLSYQTNLHNQQYKHKQNNLHNPNYESQLTSQITQPYIQNQTTKPQLQNQCYHINSSPTYTTKLQNPQLSKQRTRPNIQNQITKTQNSQTKLHTHAQH